MTEKMPDEIWAIAPTKQKGALGTWSFFDKPTQSNGQIGTRKCKERIRYIRSDLAPSGKDVNSAIKYLEAVGDLRKYATEDCHKAIKALVFHAHRCAEAEKELAVMDLIVKHNRELRKRIEELEHNPLKTSVNALLNKGEKE